MSNKGSSNIKSMGGIDTRFSRESNRFSDGKNFYTRGGSMFTRPGTILIPSTLTGEIKAMCQAPLPGHKTILIAEHGGYLYHWVDGVWAQKIALTSAAPLKFCRFINSILMVNGTDRRKYDIVNDTYYDLIDTGDTAIPALENIVTWKFRPFGWMPNSDEGHLLRFCGYDTNGMIDPKVWPPDFSIDVGGSVGSPIYAAIPCGNHLLVLTENSYTPVYGNTEEDFEVGISGQTSVLRPDTAGGIGDNILWVGKDVNSNMCVYLYSGTEPIVISDPLQDFLPDIDISTLFVKVFRSQLWVICPETTTSRVFVFDTVEKEWYIYDYPFKITAGTMFGEQGQEDFIYLGSNPGVIKCDPLVDTDIGSNDITTSFKWGPVSMNNRELKPRTLYVVGEPENDFTLSVTEILDNNPEPNALPIPFKATTPVKQVTEPLRVPRDKGYNMSFLFETTDKINKLNGLTAVFKAKGEK